MALLAFGEKTGVGMYRVSSANPKYHPQAHVQTLYDPKQWDHARGEFRKTFLTLYALPGQPLLSLALSAGLSTLRLPSCVKYEPTKPDSPKSPTIPLLPAAPPMHTFADYIQDYSSIPRAPTLYPLRSTEDRDVDIRDEPDAEVGNVDCPTCGEDMKVLASEVPMSHHVNSTLVCRISGRVMDDSNPPMAFPNGHVYSANVSSLGVRLLS